MFPTNALGSALRAAGVVKPTMLIQTATVLINAVLAPVLIAGWGTGHPLGVFGAGLASSIAAAVGFVGTLYVFGRSQTLIAHPLKLPRPDFAMWRRIIGIGLPSAAEFLLMFITTGVVYAVIRHFGPEAQAGYGVGSRVMQAVFLPAMAVSFAVAPGSGPEFRRRPGRPGAPHGARRRRPVDRPDAGPDRALPHPPRPDDRRLRSRPGVIEIGSTFLKIISLNFIATGLIFTASGTFQALGDTRPALFGSVSRLITFAGPAIWLSTQPWARLEHVWMLSAASVFVHMLIALFFLRRELARKLAGLMPRETVPA
jgi:Na+-driven multidrug efflux pump